MYKKVHIKIQDRAKNLKKLCRAPNLSTSIFTLIQAYLPTNLVYTRLALISKRIREALNSSGLRIGRNLTIHVPEQKQYINRLYVLKMIEFSEIITLYIKCKEENSHEQQLLNLEKLSECLISAIYELKTNTICIESRFQLKVGKIKHLQIPITRDDIQANYMLQQLSQIGCKNFFIFLDCIESLNQLSFRHLRFQNYQCKREEYLTKITSQNILSKYNLILAQCRQSINKLSFQKCGLVGNFTACWPLIHSNIEIIMYKDCRLHNRGTYGPYKNMKELRVINCVTLRNPEKDENPELCIKVCQGVTIEIIEKLINSESTQTQIKTLKILEADINVGKSIETANQSNCQLLISVETCILRDHYTLFTFSMIFTILHTSDESTSSMPPISLEVSRFENIKPFQKASCMSNEKELKEFAGKQGLLIYGYEEVATRFYTRIIVLHIKLMDREGRRMMLKMINK